MEVSPARIVALAARAIYGEAVSQILSLKFRSLCLNHLGSNLFGSNGGKRVLRLGHGRRSSSRESF
jgi:hypothetical protein